MAGSETTKLPVVISYQGSWQKTLRSQQDLWAFDHPKVCWPEHINWKSHSFIMFHLDSKGFHPVVGSLHFRQLAVLSWPFDLSAQLSRTFSSQRSPPNLRNFIPQRPADWLKYWLIETCSEEYRWVQYTIIYIYFLVHTVVAGRFLLSISIHHHKRKFIVKM